MKELLPLLKYYNGEKKNPFNNDTENTKCQFWFYEETFCHKFLNGDFGKMKPKTALDKFLDNLFTHLADKYDAMDNGAEMFRKMYEKG